MSYGQEKKDKVWVSWGYNRSAYTNSDIHFQGDNFDFELHKVKATDRPTPVGPEYWDPKTITIPQYSYRVGYYISDSLALSVGIDHLKYVMVDGQQSTITGTISESASSIYAGDYDGDDIVLDPDDFLQFEHSDGLNYVDVELSVIRDLYSWGKGHRIDAYYGGGLGVYIPKTRINLFGELIDNRFHLAGPGASMHAAARATFWDIVFVETVAKVGYAYLPSVLVVDSSSRADHQFGWGMVSVSFGASF